MREKINPDTTKFVATRVIWGDAPCHTCARYRHNTTCEAFPAPGGIPEEILAGDDDHRRPVEGDHGMLFQPKK